jgi:hypothetical protein
LRSSFLLDALKGLLPLVIARITAADITAGSQLVERLHWAREAHDSRAFVSSTPGPELFQ